MGAGQTRSMRKVTGDSNTENLLRTFVKMGEVKWLRAIGRRGNEEGIGERTNKCDAGGSDPVEGKS